MTYAEQFAALKTDADRWKWIMDNQGKGLVVLLDNDNTSVVDCVTADTADFDGNIGWDKGAQALLDAIGIEYTLA